MTTLTYHQLTCHQLTCHDQSTHPDNRERFTLALSADQTGLETLARTLQATRADEQPVPARHLTRPQYTVTQAELTLQPPELLAERPRWHARIDTTCAQSGPQDTLSVSSKNLSPLAETLTRTRGSSRTPAGETRVHRAGFGDTQQEALQAARTDPPTPAQLPGKLPGKLHAQLPRHLQAAVRGWQPGEVRTLNILSTHHTPPRPVTCYLTSDEYGHATLHLFGDASSLPHAPQHTLTVTLSSLTPDAGRAFRLGQSRSMHAPEKQDTENQTPPAGPA